ncbi:biofilm regulatory protein A [Lachnospiraceae bacterium]|nr:biofilm regulatory protein A [Lachnospiraceae bacterium]
MKKSHRKRDFVLLIAGILIISIVILYFLSWSSALLKMDKAIDGEVRPVRYEGKHYRYNEDLINILCLGIDHSNALDQEVLPGDRGQSDAIFLISLNAKTRQMKILNIPRDLMMPINIYDSKGNFFTKRTMQLTLQYAYGNDGDDSCKKTAGLISTLLLDIPIHRYCAVNFNAVPVLNDAVGGVTLQMDSEHVDVELQKLSPMFAPGNTVHLMGERCFEYLHVRDIHTYASCEERAERQKVYIKEYIEAVKKKAKEDPRLLFKLYSILDENMTTDIGKLELLSLPFYLDELDFEASIISIEGKRIQGEIHEEFYANDEELERLVVETFYTLSDE